MLSVFLLCNHHSACIAGMTSPTLCTITNSKSSKMALHAIDIKTTLDNFESAIPYEPFAPLFYYQTVHFSFLVNLELIKQ